MAERLFRKLGRERVARPMPQPVIENQPVPHTSKKPILAVTGTKPDRICAICLGKLEPGIALTFCNCGKYFHMACISELCECPLCGFIFNIQKAQMDYNSNEAITFDSDSPSEVIPEIVYQCPVCKSYVPENSERCSCGAVFDMDEEEIYLCPQCGNEVGPDSERCDKCGMIYV